MGKFMDLEESIMDCWSVTDELRAFAEHSKEPRTIKLLQSLATVYDFKMERLNDLYEDCLKEHYELKNAPTQGKVYLTDSIIEDVATEFADYGGDISREKWVPFARSIIGEQEVANQKEDDLPW